MSLHRFLVEPARVAGDRVEFVGEQARQICRILRLGPGNEIVAVVGDGPGLRVCLEAVTPTRVLGRLEDREPDREPSFQMTLFQGILKGDRFDLVVQKATEIGIARIVPLSSARCVVLSANFENKQRRWAKIAREAVEQSGRWRVPEVETPVSVAEAAERLGEFNAAFVFWENERSMTLKEVLRGVTGRPLSAAIIIGPEGGLSEEEVHVFERCGAKRVSLGPRILRSESAAVVASALLMYEFGDLGARD